ncbi:MAG: (Fe-S)-binding protein [Actinomycetes bacterium]|jgi:Fe-S oxidoreductase/nitrate reductase gamma subunit|nr:MAG: iron-sulfur protein [Actinomycetota bacterium]
MTVTEERRDTDATPAKRFTVSRALRVLGVVAALATAAMGVAGSFQEHLHFEIGREVFGNIPGPFKVVFYVVIPAFIGLAFFLFARRAEIYEQGASERRTGLWGERVRRFVRGLAMRTVMRDKRAGIMHSAIYWGFVVLFLGTVTVELDHLAPARLKFLHGTFYLVFSFVLDLASLVFLGGLALAFLNRYVLRPWRLKSKTKPEDGLILLTLAAIGVTGLLTEAARIVVDGRPDHEVWSFLGYLLSPLFSPESAATWHRVAWVVHVATFAMFLVVLPTTKLRHMFTSPVDLALSPRKRPKGAMREMPNLFEVEDIETIGAHIATDLTWKQLFDTEACTVCGRCTAVCPANLTGKPLDPREMVLKSGEVAASMQGLEGPVTSSAVLEGAGVLFERITTEELYSCTTCRACDEICPVGIEIVDRILDMRRYLTLMESDFPAELGKAFMAMENQTNPWGMSQQARADWTSELDFEIPRLGDGVERAEYLWFVGCAGSYDDRNKAVSVALARLLKASGIDFAILGMNEVCSGDPARRAGNEYVFQQLALQNISTFEEYGVRKVITQCAHCFNTIRNEYPQFGGEYEVVHHSQLLAELLSQGRLEVPKKEDGTDKKIVYHDPCYLGRYNDVYLAPREVAGAGGAEVVEMGRHGTRSLCCGAGGARFWMEEKVGKKVNVERAEEALATGADEIAIACPFCFVMLDDGVKELGQEIPVRDIAMILADGLEGPTGA